MAELTDSSLLGRLRARFPESSGRSLRQWLAAARVRVDGAVVRDGRAPVGPELGHPIVGDRVHGSRRDPLRRLCLHATGLGFVHPATGTPVRFDSPPPAWGKTPASSSPRRVVDPGTFRSPSTRP